MQTIANLVRSVKKSSLLLRASAAAFAAGGVMAINLLTAAPAAACHCQTLDVSQVNRNTFSFKGDLDTLGGGRITKAVYNFGDGTSTTTTDNNPVTHEYKEAGNFTANVTIFLELDGQTRELTGPACAKQVEVKPEPPVYECTALEAQRIEVDTFRFTAKAHTANGTTLESANFDFGDGKNAADVKPDSDNTVSIGHQYLKDGNYKASVDLRFKAGDEVKDITCETSVTVKAPVCEFDANLPKSSPDCKKPEQPQTPQKPGQPKAPQPQQKAELPKELPATGATDLISGGVGLGGIVAAGTHYIRSRRNLRNVR